MGNLSNILYPNQFEWLNYAGPSMGIREAYPDTQTNTVTWLMGEATKIIIYDHPTEYSDPLTLYTLNNGVKIQYSYKSIPYQENPNLIEKADIIMQAVGIDGTVLYSENAVLNTNMNKPAGEAYFYYYPSQTYYDRADSTYGGSARAIFALGEWMNLNPNVPEGEAVDLRTLQGKVKNRSEVWDEGWKEAWGVKYIVTDGDLNNFFTTIENGGNGNEFVKDNPAGGDDPSGTGGGHGSYRPDKGKNVIGDGIGFPGLPSVGVVGTGLVSLYNPSALQLRSLAGELWSDDFFDNISKILNDPFDGVISLSMLPFDIPAGTADIISLGNYVSQVSAPVVTQQYVTIDCGSLTIEENWGNALDYSPYSQIDLYVPFCGFHTLNMDDCMGKTLYIKYNIDVLTGAGVCMVMCDRSVLYVWACNVGYQIPLTGSNMRGLYTGLINAALAVTTGAVVGGASGAAMGAINSAANVMMNKAGQIERGGSISGNNGILGELQPYVVLHRPIQSLPSNFEQFKGYPANITSVLGALVGYVEVDYIHLEGMSATDKELAEIEDYLKSGVII